MNTDDLDVERLDVALQIISSLERELKNLRTYAAGLLAEAEELQRRIIQNDLPLDCRSCRNYREGACTLDESKACEDGDSYKREGFVRLWDKK